MSLPESYTTVGAPTEDWELIVDALLLMSSKCEHKFDAPKLAERYSRMARRLQKHLDAKQETA